MGNMAYNNFEFMIVRVFFCIFDLRIQHDNKVSSIFFAEKYNAILTERDCTI